MDSANSFVDKIVADPLVGGFTTSPFLHVVTPFILFTITGTHFVAVMVHDGGGGAVVLMVHMVG